MTSRSVDSRNPGTPASSTCSGSRPCCRSPAAELCLGCALDEAATVNPAKVDAALRDDPATPALTLGDDRDRPYYVLVKADERLHGTSATPPPAPLAGTAQALPWIDIGLFEKVRRIGMGCTWSNTAPAARAPRRSAARGSSSRIRSTPTSRRR